MSFTIIQYPLYVIIPFSPCGFPTDFLLVACKIAFFLPVDFQGLPGQDGPPGPRGVSGCNGTKVSLKKIIILSLDPTTSVWKFQNMQQANSSSSLLLKGERGLPGNSGFPGPQGLQVGSFRARRCFQIIEHGDHCASSSIFFLGSTWSSRTEGECICQGDLKQVF